MGPKRFGAKGRLAFSFGNVAQDEGSAMAEYAWKQGLADRVARDRHGDRLLPQRRPGVQGPLAAARRQDRRPRRRTSPPAATRRRGRARRHAAEREAGRRDRDVDGAAVRRAGADPERPADAREQHAVPQLVGRRRQLLVHAGPEGHELLLRDVRLGLRRRPGAGGQRAREAERSAIAKAGSTGGFVTGPAAIDGILVALKRTGGNTNGAALAAQMEKFKNVPDALGARELLERSCTRCSGGSTA